MRVTLSQVWHVFEIEARQCWSLMCFAGAFGSGAAFALEDGWILARAIEHSRFSPDSIAEALEIVDTIRSPYYLRMLVKVNEHITMPSS